jgi:hypothetical protein
MAQKDSKTPSSKQTSVKPHIGKKGETTNLRSLRHRPIETVENFIVIWLDSNINESNEGTRNSIDHLRQIVNSVKTFDEAARCIDYLNDVKHEKVFMIVSGSLGQHVVPRISSLNQWTSIYVFCGTNKNINNEPRTSTRSAACSPRSKICAKYSKSMFGRANRI